MNVNKNLLGKLTLMFLIVIILSQSVFAWGLLPARQLAPFTTNTQQLSMNIKNTDYSDGYFMVEFSGDLAEYATYSGGVIYISADQSSYDVPFSLTLPAELEPGKRTLRVMIKEVSSSDSHVTVESLLTLIGEVVVNAPQQGNYVTAQLFVESVSESYDVPITITLLNKGDDVVIVYADVDIISPTNKVLSTWSTDKKILDYLGSSKIETFWKDPKQSGLYYVKVTLHYGDKTQVLRKEFFVGNQEVVSETISSNRFSLGDIIPLTITAHNKWNDEMFGVYAEIYVLTKDGQLVQTFKSVPEDMFANSKKDILAYWDTHNLLVGNYDINVVMIYPTGQSQKQYSVSIGLNKFEVDNDVTGQVISETSKGGVNSLFILLLFVLIVSNGIIIWYFKRMKKSGGKS